MCPLPTHIHTGTSVGIMDDGNLVHFFFLIWSGVLPVDVSYVIHVVFMRFQMMDGFAVCLEDLVNRMERSGKEVDGIDLLPAENCLSRRNHLVVVLNRI